LFDKHVGSTAWDGTRVVLPPSFSFGTSPAFNCSITAVRAFFPSPPLSDAGTTVDAADALRLIIRNSAPAMTAIPF
jgi:hypothetical protein